MYLIGLFVVAFLLTAIIAAFVSSLRRIGAGLAAMSAAMLLLLYGCASMFSGKPAQKPTLLVSARATASGWEVTVKGKARPPYRIMLDGKEVASLDDRGTVTVAEPTTKASHYRPDPVRTFKAVSNRDDVTDTSRVCSPVVILSARGTNENSTDATDEDKERFHQGLGDRGWRTWQKVQANLHLPVDSNDVIVSAHPVRYPAIFGSARPYIDSRDEGTRRLTRMWAEVRRLCRQSTIVMVGYSQGADVVASAWLSGESMKQEDAARSAVSSVVLYADPHFAKKWQDQAVTFPVAATFRKNGMLGSRRKLTSSETAPLQSWCFTKDPICQKDAVWKPWHGPAYACYEEHAAFRIANEIAPVLQNQGYEVGNPADPTCEQEL